MHKKLTDLSVPKAPKDRRLRIPSKSIHNVKEQEKKSTSGKKKTPAVHFRVRGSNGRLEGCQLLKRGYTNYIRKDQKITTNPFPPRPVFWAIKGGMVGVFP